jgi:hypothetical protein
MGTKSSRASSHALSATIAAALATAAGGARAQDDVLESVTVTATRRAESIQEVPLRSPSITKTGRSLQPRSNTWNAANG